MKNSTIKRSVTAIVAAIAGGAWACTGLYAGKQVTEDGTIFVARTVDSAPWTSAHRFVSEPRVTNKPGRIYKVTNDGFTWNLPPTTYAFVSTPKVEAFGRGAMHSACVNDMGLAVSGTVTAHARADVLAADPMVAGGAGENSLPGLLIQCCATAREAVELLGKVLAEKGHNGGEIYMFADRNEAWYVEVYSGHNWAAVKMPDDAVACYGNQFMLRSFDPKSPETLHSPGLFELAAKVGGVKKGTDGLPDLYRTFCGELGDYSNYRTWFGHHLLAPETAGEYAVDKPMPLFFKPGRKVTRRDFFEVMRTRYEGTDRNPEANKLQDVRVIGTTKQATCHLLTVDPTLPPELASTLWGALGQAEHTPFMPLNAIVTDHDADYARDQKAWGWDPAIAGYHFRRLAALAETDRKFRGWGVRQFWRQREDEYLTRYSAALKAAATTFAKDKVAAAKALTDFTIAEEKRALADVKRMFDELNWYIMLNNRIRGDGSGATAEPREPFSPTGMKPLTRTRVLFFFDTEDFTCDESNDAIRDIANILHEEGVRGQFAMIGYLGKYIPEMKRQDVIDALKHHLVGSQTLYHSAHPNIVEYGDIADFEAAYARTWKEEKEGCDLLTQGLGAKKMWCSVFPGNANSYVGLYAHAKMGIPFFGGGNASFTPGEGRPAAWYVNQFHLPYYKALHLESFIPPRPALDIPARLDELATNRIVTLYMHPHMALSKQHWDGPNFDPKNPVEWGKWRPTPKRDKRDVAEYYVRLRALVRALKADPRFDVTDCEQLLSRFPVRKAITRKEVPAIRAALAKRLAPITKPQSLCVADAFQAAVAFLGGAETFTPGFVWGFLEMPKGVTRETTVKTVDLKAAAAKLNMDTFIPAEIEVGGTKIGPADFLLAALEAVETGADTVKVTPKGDQLGPIGELMPSLSTYSMKGGWPLYLPTFEDKYLTPRLRLQLWTLRYEDL